MRLRLAKSGSRRFRLLAARGEGESKAGAKQNGPCAHGAGEGLGKRDARSGQTGVTGRYPLVACGKGRTRYCYCAFLHPSRTVQSALLQAASDSQISLAFGHSHAENRFNSRQSN